MIRLNINPEINSKQFSEEFFFGLNLRESIFSALAVGAAVGVRFVAAKYTNNTELLTWASLISAVPFAFFGFFSFNGMNAEQFFVAIFKYVLSPRILLYHSTTLFFEATADELENNLKEKLAYYE